MENSPLSHHVHLVHRRLPGLLHALRARAVYLMVYWVCRDVQEKPRYADVEKSDRGGLIPSQVRFADCSRCKLSRSAFSSALYDIILLAQCVAGMAGRRD